MYYENEISGQAAYELARALSRAAECLTPGIALTDSGEDDGAHRLGVYPANSGALGTSLTALHVSTLSVLVLRALSSALRSKRPVTVMDITWTPAPCTPLTPITKGVVSAGQAGEVALSAAIELARLHGGYDGSAESWGL